MQTDATYLRELTIRYSISRDHAGEPIRLATAICEPQQAVLAFRRILENEPTEVFGILCLSTRRHVLAYHEVSRGTLDSSLVHPREVFKPAILANASAVILAHNHPSGDPTPSPDDIALTRRLAAAGDLLGILVLDHIVIGTPRWVSLRDSGLFEAERRRC